jgi:hypothetical protein
MKNDWWEGDSMNTFDPYEELMSLKGELAHQRKLINNLIVTNNQQAEVLVNISNQQVNLINDLKKATRDLEVARRQVGLINKPL